MENTVQKFFDILTTEQHYKNLELAVRELGSALKELSLRVRGFSVTDEEDDLEFDENNSLDDFLCEFKIKQ